MDLWHVVLGRNGCGKTTRARTLALAYARAGCRVLVCDPDGQFGTIVPRIYASTQAYRDELKKAAGQKRPLVVRFADTARIPDVIALGRDLSAATNYATPSVVVVDEGTAWTDATKKQAHAELLRATGRRRNDAVGVIILQQQPSMLNYQSLANATEIDIFRLESDYQITHLIRQLPRRVMLKGGQVIDREALERQIPTLGRGKFYAVDKRFH